MYFILTDDKNLKIRFWLWKFGNDLWDFFYMISLLDLLKNI